MDDENRPFEVDIRNVCVNPSNCPTSQNGHSNSPFEPFELNRSCQLTIKLKNMRIKKIINVVIVSQDGARCIRIKYDRGKAQSKRIENNPWTNNRTYKIPHCSTWRAKLAKSIHIGALQTSLQLPAPTLRKISAEVGERLFIGVTVEISDTSGVGATYF